MFILNSKYIYRHMNILRQYKTTRRTQGGKIGDVEKWWVGKGHLGPVEVKEEIGKKNGK